MGLTEWNNSDRNIAYSRPSVSYFVRFTLRTELQPSAARDCRSLFITIHIISSGRNPLHGYSPLTSS